MDISWEPPARALCFHMLAVAAMGHARLAVLSSLPDKLSTHLCNKCILRVQPSRNRDDTRFHLYTVGAASARFPCTAHDRQRAQRACSTFGELSHWVSVAVRARERETMNADSVSQGEGLHLKERNPRLLRSNGIYVSAVFQTVSLPGAENEHVMIPCPRSRNEAQRCLTRGIVASTK